MLLLSLIIAQALENLLWHFTSGQTLCTAAATVLAAGCSAGCCCDCTAAYCCSMQHPLLLLLLATGTAADIAPPLHLLTLLQVFLDAVLPQLVQLAESDSLRSRRVTAFEGLHSIALWLIGNIAQTSTQRK